MRVLRLIAALAVAAVAVAVIFAVVGPLTDVIAKHDVGTLTGSARALRLVAARETVGTQFLTLGAGVFAAGALVYTARNFSLSRQGQVTSRYTQAIGQLGSKKLDVRLGGIYALERVALDSARDHTTVMEVLGAFIREHSREQPWPPCASGADTPRGPRPDVQAAITVIGRRNSSRDDVRINLPGVNLAKADLAGANLSSMDNNGSGLMAALIMMVAPTLLPRMGDNAMRIFLAAALVVGLHARSNFADADFTDADLTGADLDSTDLHRAAMTGAILEAACLVDADLTGAVLGDADLTAAKLTGAILKDADLTGAGFSDADLRRTDIRNANFTRTDLKGARFSPKAATPKGWVLDPSGTLRQDPATPDPQQPDDAPQPASRTAAQQDGTRS